MEYFKVLENHSDYYLPTTPECPFYNTREEAEAFKAQLEAGGYYEELKVVRWPHKPA